MGCGSSQPQARTPAANSSEGATWATKTDVVTSPLYAKADGHALGVASEKSKMTLADADNESEIEIIYEGKPKQPAGESDPSSPNGQHRHSPEANGQEAPDDAEVFQEKPPPAELPQRQKEEAAKLAEQRKRFDNQRYQREMAAAGGPSPSGFSSPTSGHLSARENTSSAPPAASQEHVAPRHDLVLGLNLTDLSPREGQCEPLSSGTLPGGIGDSPRMEVPSAAFDNKNKHKHDCLDDDDEAFMEEILDSIDVV